MVMQRTDTENLVGISDPNKILDVAIVAAKALTKVVSQKAKPVIMNGEQYLEYEDWQTLGQFYGVTTITGDAVPVDIGGVKGAKAAAKLVRLDTGEVIGGAEAYCMRDEDKWNTRPKYEWQDQAEGKGQKRVKIGDEPVPWFQLASMAQTRAGAKCLRNRLAWVAVLAGYRPTPAEELTGTETRGHQEPDKTEHWCKEHDTQFFMKGKMKAFAHPIGDTGEWCHEHTDKANTTATAPPVAIVDKVERPITTTQGLMEWVASHGKSFNRTWVTKNCSIDPDKDPMGCYEELKALQEWK